MCTIPSAPPGLYLSPPWQAPFQWAFILVLAPVFVYFWGREYRTQAPYVRSRLLKTLLRFCGFLGCVFVCGGMFLFFLVWYPSSNRFIQWDASQLAQVLANSCRTQAFAHLAQLEAAAKAQLAVINTITAVLTLGGASLLILFRIGMRFAAREDGRSGQGQTATDIAPNQGR